MPPIRSYRDHEWTRFEEHALLCLVTRGVHLDGYAKSKKSDDPNAAKRNAYLTFATTLNDILHGTDYEHDIHKKEVTIKLDHVLLKHKGILGKGGLAERQYGGRVTRVLRLAWQRSTGRPEIDKETGCNQGIASPLDFDGSISEWNQWRRKAVENKHRARLGLPLLDGVDAERERAEKVEKQNTVRPQGTRGVQKLPARKWRSQQNALSNEYVDDETIQGSAPILASNKILQTKLDSFGSLPANVRLAGKYQWANPEAPQPNARQQAFLGGLRGAAAIAAFQNTGAESPQGLGWCHGYSRSSSRREPYVPPTKSRYFASGPKSGSGMSARAQGSSESVPGLTHDYPSSDNIDPEINTPANIAGTNHLRLASSGFMTPPNLNDSQSDSAAKGLDSKLTSSKGVAAGQVAGKGGQAGMGAVEEGEIWADLDAAKGFAA